MTDNNEGMANKNEGVANKNEGVDRGNRLIEVKQFIFQRDKRGGKNVSAIAVPEFTYVCMYVCTHLHMYVIRIYSLCCIVTIHKSTYVCTYVRKYNT